MVGMFVCIVYSVQDTGEALDCRLLGQFECTKFRFPVLRVLVSNQVLSKSIAGVSFQPSRTSFPVCSATGIRICSKRP